MSDIAHVVEQAKSLALDIYGIRTDHVARGDDDGACEILLEIHDDLVQMASRLASLDESTVLWEDEVEAPMATRLRELLDESQMTVASLAETAGVSKTTITNILEGETTRPQRKTLAKIEEVFGLEEGALHG